VRRPIRWSFEEAKTGVIERRRGMTGGNKGKREQHKERQREEERKQRRGGEGES
jgi:hypothetical protein